MRKNKVLLATIFLLSTSFVMVSCGEDSVNDTKTTYRVNFENTNLEEVTINEGDKLNEVEAPNKDGYRFVGWYLDSGFNNEVNFPLTITSNTTLYAKYITNLDYFILARDNSISCNYSYTDNLKIETTLLGAISGPSANRVGEIYKRNNGDITYFSHYTSSGALLYDGEEYTILNLGKEEVIKLNEDKELTSYKVSDEIDSNNTSTFAKAIFEYNKEDINNLTLEEDGSYLLDCKATASNIVSSILGLLNNEVMQNFIKYLPDNFNDFKMYVTFKDDYIDTYRYEFNLDLENVGNLTLSYSLKFNDFGDNSIALLSFIDLGLALNKDDKEIFIGEANKINDTYKNKNLSKYEYSFNSSITNNEELKLKAKVSGEATRKLENNNIYFNNYIKVDTNYNDLYLNVDNYEINRANTLNYEVYNCVNNLFNDEFSLSTFRDTDNYYLYLDSSFFKESNFLAISQNKDKESFTFLLNEVGTSSLINFFNEEIYLKIDSNDNKLYGLSISNIETNKSELKLTYQNVELESISINIGGLIDLNLDKKYQDLEFEINYELNTMDIESYAIPSSKEDIKLN